MFDVLLLIVGGPTAMAPRVPESDEPRRDGLAVLAFVDREASPLAWDFGPICRVRDRFWAYEFSPERNPQAAQRYGVQLWPTYIVTHNGREVWRTHDPATLAEGLGLE